MFQVWFSNFGYGIERDFATVADALAAGKAAHFEFTVANAAGLVLSWSPIGGTRHYRPLGPNGEPVA